MSLVGESVVLYCCTILYCTVQLHSITFQDDQRLVFVCLALTCLSGGESSYIIETLRTFLLATSLPPWSNETKDFYS